MSRDSVPGLWVSRVVVGVPGLCFPGLCCGCPGSLRVSVVPEMVVGELMGVPGGELMGVPE